MYKIKQKPEDFFVIEKTNMNLEKAGKYTYFIMKKKDYTTEKAIQVIADYFKIQRKRFGYAGNKDKRAITEQYCSVLGNIKNKKLKDIEIEEVGKGNTPISLGDLKENYFEITVRNLNDNEKPKKIDYVPNYFDDQRFGKNKNNHLIGKAIIKKDFEKAVKIINPDFEGTDYVGFLRKIPKKILMIYVHSYQSCIFNLIVEQYLQCKYKNKVKNNAENFDKHINKNIKIPLIGFSTEIEEIEIKEITENIMLQEKITYRDFIIRQIPELSSEGNERDLFVYIENLKSGELEEDELNQGKKKVKVSFSLSKGAYATNVIKHLFC